MKKFIVLILALNMYLGVFAQFTPRAEKKTGIAY